MSEKEETNETPIEEKNVTYTREFVDKVLNEKKNAMAALTEQKRKVNEYEIQLKEAEDARLREKEDFKSLAERRLQEVEEWKQKYTSHETKLQTQVKLGAVKREFEKMGVKDAKAIEAIAPLLKLDSIKYDEITQTVIGAEDEVKRIKEQLPQLFVQTQAVGAQHAAPQGTPSAINVDNYKAMMKDGTWNKMSKIERQDYESKLWSSLGVDRKH